MILGAWSRKTVVPPASMPTCAGVIAVTVVSTDKFTAAYADWKMFGLATGTAPSARLACTPDCTVDASDLCRKQHLRVNRESE
jgi:hypothetical protein